MLRFLILFIVLITGSSAMSQQYDRGDIMFACSPRECSDLYILTIENKVVKEIHPTKRPATFSICAGRKPNEFITGFYDMDRMIADQFIYDGKWRPWSLIKQNSKEGEIKYLRSYLELESMRFAHTFSFSVEVDPEIDADNTYIPTMILQPYVENSIRHGLRYKQDGDKSVKVSFLKRGNTLACIVEDNGVGRKKASELKSFMHLEYQSKGMRLAAERIETLNCQQDIPITVDVMDMELNGKATGTQALVRFPNAFLWEAYD